VFFMAFSNDAKVILYITEVPIAQWNFLEGRHTCDMPVLQSSVVGTKCRPRNMLHEIQLVVMNRDNMISIFNISCALLLQTVSASVHHASYGFTRRSLSLLHFLATCLSVCVCRYFKVGSVFSFILLAIRTRRLY